MDIVANARGKRVSPAEIGTYTWPPLPLKTCLQLHMLSSSESLALEACSCSHCNRWPCSYWLNGGRYNDLMRNLATVMKEWTIGFWIFCRKQGKEPAVLKTEILASFKNNKNNNNKKETLRLCSVGRQPMYKKTVTASSCFLLFSFLGKTKNKKQKNIIVSSS